jgi:cytoskeletal protein RodZ
VEDLKMLIAISNLIYILPAALVQYILATLCLVKLVKLKFSDDRGFSNKKFWLWNAVILALVGIGSLAFFIAYNFLRDKAFPPTAGKKTYETEIEETSGVPKTVETETKETSDASKTDETEIEETSGVPKTVETETKSTSGVPKTVEAAITEANAAQPADETASDAAIENSDENGK